MKYHIDKDSTTSAYMQLYHQLREDIADGTYRYGAKLPSKRLLAEESGTSVITVEHAYAILCDEGYIETRQRSGYFVIYRKHDFLSSAESTTDTSAQAFYGPHTGTHITHNTHAAHTHTDSEFPFSVLSKTMRKIMLDYGEDILVKSPNHGCVELREAIASYLARSTGIHVQPEQIIIGSGAEYLYSLLVQLLGNERIFALESPSYDKIYRVYQACGVMCDMLTLGPDGIETAELNRTKATVLHITPFNSYPSHITAGVSKRNEYIRWAQTQNAYIIEDNYDSELTVSSKHEDTVFSLAPDGMVIYLNTFSKTIAPSIRVGYMVLPNNLLKMFEDKLGFYSCTVPVFEQYVLAELINSGDFERHINRVRRARRKSRDIDNK
ncbi:MAG: PLP-dependent aminotransferase family protein [Lachnospiraceae bacterium]|nr:PLP-dependent aminotransferase family protein [Lachnospiraceae bacterium]